VRVIPFTEGAADPLLEWSAWGARFVPLADGSGDAHVACLHLAAGGRIAKLPMTQACALESRDGAVLIFVQGQHLEAHECAISTPQRIMGQRWPGDALPGQTGESQGHAGIS